MVPLQAQFTTTTTKTGAGSTGIKTKPVTTQTVGIPQTSPRQIGDADAIDKLGLTAFAEVATMTVLGLIAGFVLYGVLEKVRGMALGSVQFVRDRYFEDEKIAFDLMTREQDAKAAIVGYERQANALAEDLNRRFPNRAQAGDA